MTITVEQIKSILAGTEENLRLLQKQPEYQALEQIENFVTQSQRPSTKSQILVRAGEIKSIVDPSKFLESYLIQVTAPENASTVLCSAVSH